MGEIADMMINGFLDCETGEFLDGDEPGYPRTLADLQPNHSCRQKKVAKWGCSECAKHFETQNAVMQHVIQKHTTFSFFKVK